LKTKLQTIKFNIEQRYYQLLEDIQQEQELITFMMTIKTNLKGTNSILRSAR